MDTDTAYNLGVAAFKRGEGNFPFADPAMVAEFEGVRPGFKTHLLRAFNKGWTDANVAADPATSAAAHAEDQARTADLVAEGRRQIQVWQADPR